MRLAIAAIALSVAVMIVTISVVLGFKQEIQQKIIGFSAPIQISGEFLNSTFENKPFEDKELTRETVLDFDFVKHVQPYALKPGILKANEDFEGVVLKGVDRTYNVDFFSKTLVRGRFLDFDAEDQVKEVIISSPLANKLSVDTGAKVTVWFVQDPPLIKSVTVVGIYQTDIEEIDDHFVITDLNIVRQVSGWEDHEIGGYEVLLHETNLGNLTEQNSEIRFAIDLGLNSQSIMNRFPQIFDWLGLLDKNVQIIITLMTIVAIINMITALLIMILERTQMIGILKILWLPQLRFKKSVCAQCRLLHCLRACNRQCFGVGFNSSSGLFSVHFTIIRLLCNPCSSRVFLGLFCTGRLGNYGCLLFGNVYPIGTGNSNIAHKGT